jgi:hypothetical protein
MDQEKPAKQKPDLKTLIASRRKWYYALKPTHCRYLNEKVVFNNHGFRHALRDGRGHYRIEADARMRLNLLTWATKVIQTAVYMPNTERREVGDPRNSLDKPVTYFELQGTVSHKIKGSNERKYIEITVILRRIGDGQLHYFSIRYTKKAP